MCVHVYIRVCCECAHACAMSPVQRTEDSFLKFRFTGSTMWALGMELVSLGLPTRTFTL